MSREPRGLSTSALEAWLRAEHPQLVGESGLDATLITGGRSNLTYRVLGGPAPLVLRRPPLGHVLASAHDMAREFRVISALGGSTVPGLEDFGRASGYLERQVHRWGEQYDKSRNRELPELDALQAALRESVPSTVSSSLVHGDFRLDNAIVRVDAVGRPRVAAILDWEMATIGDSFTDLGLLGLYWDISSISEQAAAVATSAVDRAAGYPPFAELLDAYAAARGTPVPELSWYLAFAAYKLAIILEGIHLRFQARETVGPGFDTIGGLVPHLAQAGLHSLTERTV